MQLASLAALVGLLVHYICFYLSGTPLLTEALAEYIMAETPSRYAVAILNGLGEWAKPSAMTGGLATLGALLWVARWRWWAGLVGFAAVLYLVEYRSVAGLMAFVLPAAALLFAPHRLAPVKRNDRRSFLLSASMAVGTIAVAGESFLRNRSMASRAVEPVPLFAFEPPPEKDPRFAPPLVRKAVTPVNEFYAMSKNSVDPVIDPAEWRLRVATDDRVLAEYSYSQLLALPREERFVTLRCISNTLQSNLMGNALWSGFPLRRIVERSQVPADAVEMAVIGVDGHGDSFPLDYAFGGETLLAVGMNGRTLDRTHGFPLRLLVPRYYGFKHIKWIGEIRFVRKPYFGTWPKKGYTKDPAIHTVCFIDRVMRNEGKLLTGGIAFAGSRGIRRVQVRADDGPWIEAECESPLSAFAWTRWRAVIPIMNATSVEARAMDGAGRWQAEKETPLFPNGVAGPTRRSISL